MLITCKCSVCGKEFKKHESLLRKRWKLYCSKECRYGIKELIIKEDCILVPLTQNKFAIIDLNDIDKVKNHYWRTHKGPYTYYAMTSQGLDSIGLHRIIMELPLEEKKFVVDHKDFNGLNNRKSNLRICSKLQNLMNKKSLKNSTSHYKGVSLYQDKWSANIGYNNKTYNLGLFDNEIDAAVVYDKKAKELYGEFAYLNFIMEN